MTQKPSILFLGTPEFGLFTLKKLYENNYPIALVITQKDRPAGRGRQLRSPPCAEFAKEKNLPLLQIESFKEEGITEKCLQIKPDFIVSSAFGIFIPEKILLSSKKDTLNVHPSLLPKYRGAAPIQWTLLNGDEKAGITIMRTTKKMDSGPIFLQEDYPIHDDDTSQTLNLKLAKRGAELLIKTIELILDNQIKAQEQNEDNVLFAPALKKDDGIINWNQSAQKIHFQIRALQPWPTAMTFLNGKRFKIFKSQILNEKSAAQAGEIYLINEKGIHIACQDSSLLLEEVQIEGKKRMKASDCARGLRLEVGQSFSSN